VEIEVVETGQVFTGIAEFSVGSASDVLLDFQCNGSEPAISLFWFKTRPPEFEQIRKPFDQTTTSYDPSSGLLRLYSEFLDDPAIISSGFVRLQCFRNSNSVDFDLRPVPTLFFTGAFPASVGPSEDIVSLCSSLLPDLPASTITTVPASDHTYCEVQTARGAFRSPSIPTRERDTGPTNPMFIAEPLNITVQPINGVTRGAFSCVVSPSDTVQSVAWFFQSGTGDPMAVEPAEAAQTTGGTSVLVLDGVDSEREGFYHCLATLDNGGTLPSRAASLELSETTSNMERILLAPPTSLSVSEGNQLLIPCVGSTDPTFDGDSSAETRGNSSSFGLTITADRRDGGSIVCEVGGDTAELILTVLAGPRFEEELVEEVRRFLNTDSSPLLLACEASGNPLPSLSFLLNNKPLPTSSRVTVEAGAPSCNDCVRSEVRIERPGPGDQGVYQCVAQVGQDPSTAIVSSSYLNLQCESA
jgi:hypothetical protein